MAASLVEIVGESDGEIETESVQDGTARRHEIEKIGVEERSSEKEESDSEEEMHSEGESDSEMDLTISR